jgi:anti-sigma regulatory factor (Ser/Thr protein kinase)
MWRYDATPTRVPPVTPRTPRPRAARTVAAHQSGRTVSPAEGGGMEVSVAAGDQAPAVARAAVERWLSGRVSETLFDDVRLLVSELVTNSVRHAQLTGDATIRVSIVVAGGAVRLEVEDAGDGAIAAVPPDREHGGGFGLYLVETLAERWGSTHEGSTCVWAELAVAPAT